MAASKPISTASKDLTCSLCLSLFVEPVRLDCYHNFCKSCVEKCWGHRRQVVSCPQCQVVLSRRAYTRNGALASLCQSARQPNQELGEEQGEKVNQGREGDQSLCQEHGEKLALFCEDDEILVCVNCVDSPLHSDHRFLALERTVQKHRDQLRSCLNSMKVREKTERDLKQQQEREISELDELTSSLEQDIAAQFAKIHQYLEDKERHLMKELRKLKEEDLQPIQGHLKLIEEKLTSLEADIVKLGVHIELQDSISFLKELKSVRERYLHKEKEEDGEDEWESEDEEILMFPRKNYRRYQGPFLYTVWKEMKQIISPFPVSLTLDPNTAHHSLVLSEDLTSVSINTKKTLLLLNNPERFDQHPCVLCSEGFTWGKHYWEVEVGNKTDWDVGVTRESANRKGKLKLQPQKGYWAVGLTNGDTYNARQYSVIRTPSVKPTTIGVYLDYEGGLVSFYNADDMSVLYMHSGTFTEKLIPFMCTGSYSDRNAAPLKLRHLKL
ncbi:zinc-binding protein A33-like [Chiloscyllium punctatum]|uniref:zinc-binding protein A33-like n=1 Tax=Chiloscyllium punctatum TaxID=137246 RepID=UPI003B6384C9